MNGYPLVELHFVEIALVSLLVGGSLLYVARNTLAGIRDAARAKASGCGGCNACGDRSKSRSGNSE